MTRDELERLIKDVQQLQSELETIEVKTAQRGTPQRLYEPFSAFANSGSGVILFGLDENRNFEIVGVHNAQRLQEDIGNLVASDLEPSLRPEFTVEQLDGKTVVAVEVQELPNLQKPCYYKTAGLQKGSYIRVGNTNRLMSDYEIFGYVGSRSQPSFDEEAVTDATLADLDEAKLEIYIKELRRTRPQATYLQLPFEQILSQLRIIREVQSVIRPTLAGLLSFGKYPQSFEPQMVITFLQFYGKTEIEKTPQGARFLDNRKFEGTISEITEAAINHVLASIRKSSLIEGLYRRDIPEYPQEAIREFS